MRDLSEKAVLCNLRPFSSGSRSVGLGGARLLPDGAKKQELGELAMFGLVSIQVARRVNLDDHGAGRVLTITEIRGG